MSSTHVVRSFSSVANSILRARAAMRVRDRSPLREHVAIAGRRRAASDPAPSQSELSAFVRDPAALAAATRWLRSTPIEQGASSVTYSDDTALARSHDYAIRVAPMELSDEAMTWVDANAGQMVAHFASVLLPLSGYRAPETIASRVRAASSIESYPAWLNANRGDDAEQARRAREHQDRLADGRPIAHGDDFQLGNNFVTASDPTVTETPDGLVMASAMHTHDRLHALRGDLVWGLVLDRQHRTLEAMFIGSGRSVLPFVDIANVGLGGPLMQTAHSLLVTALNDPQLRERLTTEAGSLQLYRDIVAAAPLEVRRTAGRLRFADAFSYFPQQLQAVLPAADPIPDAGPRIDQLIDSVPPGDESVVDTGPDAQAVADQRLIAPDGAMARSLPRLPVAPGPDDGPAARPGDDPGANPDDGGGDPIDPASGFDDGSGQPGEISSPTGPDGGGSSSFDPAANDPAHPGGDDHRDPDHDHEDPRPHERE